MKTSAFVFLMVLSGVTFAKDNLMWKCTISDLNNLSWVSQSVYERKALNMAYDSCKQESKQPDSCDKNNIGCESFLNGISTIPVWQCTALDMNATPWLSDYSKIRDTAALNAKSKCTQYSSIPATCYMHMLTCKNKNEAR